MYAVRQPSTLQAGCNVAENRRLLFIDILPSQGLKLANDRVAHPERALSVARV